MFLGVTKKVMVTLYLIGSLRNPEIPKVHIRLAELGYDVFSDWYAAGERADDEWRDYEKALGRTYLEALYGLAAKHVFDFDFFHLNRAQAGVLVLPAGKSAHIEMGYLIGQKKPVFVLMDSPDRWDVMYKFARGTAMSLDVLCSMLEGGI